MAKRSIKWRVVIPHGRWMAGVNPFGTKAKCEQFISKWNQVEVNSGHSSLTFYRDGFSYKAQPEKKKA